MRGGHGKQSREADSPSMEFFIFFLVSHLTFKCGKRESAGDVGSSSVLKISGDSPLSRPFHRLMSEIKQNQETAAATELCVARVPSSLSMGANSTTKKRIP